MKNLGTNRSALATGGGEGRRAAGRRLGRCPGWEERSWGKEEV